MKKKQKHTLLRGEGTNQHTLYGEFAIEEVVDFPKVEVTRIAFLNTSNQMVHSVTSIEPYKLTKVYGLWVSKLSTTHLIKE